MLRKKLLSLSLLSLIGLSPLVFVTTTTAEEKKKPEVKQASEKKTEELNLHSIEVKILNETNKQRARYGQPPLKLSTKLMKSTRKHCRWMSRNFNMTHTSEPVAENIAYGQNTAKEVLSTWMNSSGHRANILNSSYKQIGVAAFESRNGQIYWCQQFLQ